MLSRFRTPPPVVFVTAHEQHAVEAFDLHAVDYVLKPVREERLAEAVRRVVEGGDRAAGPATTRRSRSSAAASPASSTAPTSPTSRRRATTPGCTPPTDSHLLRSPLTTLEEEWAGAGFVRIHRSLLVSLAHVAEVRMDGGRCTVVVGPRRVELGVSRRHTRELRELLLAARTVGAVTEQPPPERVRVTGPPRRRHARRHAPRDIDARPGSAASTCGSLLREQLRLALRHPRACSA